MGCESFHFDRRFVWLDRSCTQNLEPGKTKEEVREK